MDYARYKEILVEHHDAVAVVTLNRPELLNAVTVELHDELEHLWLDLARDEKVNAIVITGAGKAFSAGGNIKKMLERHHTPEGWRSLTRVGQRARNLLRNLLDVPQPIVAAVHGDAMGFGATLALSADISVMSQTARIGDSHVKVGLVAGDGGAVLWPLLVGANKAKECLMLGRILNGTEAAAMGLVNHALPSEEVLPRAMALAQELSLLPPLAVRWTKQAANMHIKAQFNLVFDAAIAHEMLTFQSDDHGEAARAFVEKRKGKFQGI
jgi:enoyl-CoA hydratase